MFVFSVFNYNDMLTDPHHQQHKMKQKTKKVKHPIHPDFSLSAIILFFICDSRMKLTK